MCLHAFGLGGAVHNKTCHACSRRVPACACGGTCVDHAAGPFDPGGPCTRAGAGKPPLLQACVRAPKVVDTTGAGDCFTAAFAVAVLEGREPQDALRFASAAASICVQRPGAMPSLPSADEVQQLLASL